LSEREDGREGERSEGNGGGRGDGKEGKKEKNIDRKRRRGTRITSPVFAEISKQSTPTDKPNF
jgi:hypothetical protein